MTALRLKSRIRAKRWTRWTGRPINPATGPLFIEGAMPGDVLKIGILDIQVDGTGVMAAIPQAGLLGDRVLESGIKVLPMEGGAVRFHDELSIPSPP